MLFPLTQLHSAPAENEIFQDKNTYVAFDFSRFSRKATAYHCDSFNTENIDSVITFTLCSGHFPILIHDFDEFYKKSDRIKAVFTIAPEISYNSEETRYILDYVSAGGVFIIVAGPDTIDNVSELLDSVKIDYSSRPVLWGDAGIKGVSIVNRIKLGVNSISCSLAPDQLFYNPCSVYGLEPLFFIRNCITAGKKEYNNGLFYIFCDDDFLTNERTADSRKIIDRKKTAYLIDLLKKYR